MRPYIEVRLEHGGHSIKTVGMIDSGADGSFFNIQFAQVLGFTIDPAAAVKSHGVGGPTDTWFFDLEILVLGRRVPARVAFSHTWPPGYGLLGRGDFFNAFLVGFDQRAKKVLLRPLPK